MAVVIASTQEQLADAVRLVRQYRHQEGCQCYAYRNQQGEGFCTSYESSWTTIVDKLIDRITQPASPRENT